MNREQMLQVVGKLEIIELEIAKVQRLFELGTAEQAVFALILAAAQLEAIAQTSVTVLRAEERVLSVVRDLYDQDGGS